MFSTLLPTPSANGGNPQETGEIAAFLKILITRAKTNRRINQHFKGELKEIMKDYLFIYSFILFQRHSNTLCSQSKIVYGIKASVGGISQGGGSLAAPSNLLWREEQSKNAYN